MKSSQITKKNHASGLTSSDDVAPVYAKKYNQLEEDVKAHIPSDGVGTFTNITSTSGIVTNTDNVVTKTSLATLTAGEIVGTAAGDVGHADGATLVAAPGAGYVLELLSATLIYDYDTAAYTGGDDDIAIQNGDGDVLLTTTVAGADLLEASGDKIVQLTPLSASDQALIANKPLTLKGTALTQPGTAAGVLRCYVTYNTIATGL